MDLQVRQVAHLAGGNFAVRLAMVIARYPIRERGGVVEITAGGKRGPNASAASVVDAVVADPCPVPICHARARSEYHGRP